MVSSVKSGFLLPCVFWQPVMCFVSHRRRLFNMINNLPTIFEVVTGAAKKQIKEKVPNSTHKSNNKPSMKTVSEDTIYATLQYKTSPITYSLFYSIQGLSPSQRPQRWQRPQRMKTRAARTMEKKRRKSATTPCVVPVEQTTARMSSGSAATTASGGIMGNAWRSRLLEPSISSTTSAQTAATRGRGCNGDKQHQQGGRTRNGTSVSTKSSSSMSAAFLAHRLAFRFSGTLLIHPWPCSSFMLVRLLTCVF